MSVSSAPATSSTLAPAHRARDEEDYTTVVSSSAPPTAQQLSALKAVPASMVVDTHKRSGKGRSKVRNGKIIAKFFNEVAGRPYKPLGSLLQSIRVTLGSSTILLSASITVPTFAAAQFNLSAIPGTAEYLALFDQYRIDEIEVWITPVNAQGTSAFPEVASCVDLDDANVPTTASSVQNHQGALIGGGTAGRYHCWKPHMAIATYSGAFTSYANAPATWIDSGSPAVQHFGLKMYCSPALQVTTYIMDYRVRVSFRAPGIA